MSAWFHFVDWTFHDETMTLMFQKKTIKGSVDEKTPVLLLCDDFLEEASAHYEPSLGPKCRSWRGRIETSNYPEEMSLNR